MSSLYELTDEYLQLLEIAEDPDIDATVLKDTMESINAEIEDKADNYAKVMKSMESDADGIDKEISRLRARKARIGESIKSMKWNLQQSMEATGKKKFKTELFSFGIQKNPPSVVLDTEIADIPDDFLTYKEPEANRALIKKAIEEGQEIAFAHLAQSESLRIR